MEEITLNKIEWTAPEYKHESKSVDFIWTIGLVAIVVFVLAIWRQNYLFSVFVLIAGGSLILFSIRQPQNVNFVIETKGLTMGKEKYEWKNIKGFNIKKEEGTMSTLLVEINKYLLPVYPITLPTELIPNVREELTKVIPNIELEESKSMKFMEKIGF